MATGEQQELDSAPSDIPAGLRQAVERKKWDEVGDLLGVSLSYAHSQWAVETAGRQADAWSLSTFIIPQCDVHHSDMLLVEVIHRGLWSTADVVMTRGVSDTQRRWAVEEASRRADEMSVNQSILRHCSGDQIVTVMKEVLRRKLWGTVHELLKQNVNMISKDLLGEVVLEASRFAEKHHLEHILPYCAKDNLVPVFTELLKRDLTETYRDDFYPDYNLLPTNPSGVCGRLFALWLIAVLTSDKDPEQLFYHYLPCHKFLIYVLHTSRIPGDSAEFSEDLNRWSETVFSVCRENGVDLHCDRQSFEDLFKRYFELRRAPGFSEDAGTVMVHLYALQTHNTHLQSVALRRMLKDSYSHTQSQLDPWIIVTQTCMLGVLEEVRRQVLQTAVALQKWNVVKWMCNHSVYDDQRRVLIHQARLHQQWEVIIRLAEHGLTPLGEEQAHLQVAKNADWNTVHRLLKWGADIKHIIWELKLTVSCPPPGSGTRQPLPGHAEGEPVQEMQQNPELKARLQLLRQLGAKWAQDTRTVEGVVAGREWGLALYKLCYMDDWIQSSTVMHAALQTHNQHVLVLLVKRGLDGDQRDFLFPKVIALQLWGAARALLEHGVSVQLALFAMTQLKKARQWILVGRVMEYKVGDDLRRKVLSEALDRKEGSLVAHVITCMEGGLTVQERETVFQCALDHKMWQAVLCLVAEKDGTGAEHRDKAILPAFENRQWSVVQNCVRHGADINKRSHNGLTPLQQAVVRKDSEAVKELLHLGADQSVTDSDGQSVLLTAVRGMSTLGNSAHNITLMLVEFHGDINLPDCRGNTPLLGFIDRGYADLIDRALDWGRDVHKAVNYRRETALHILCQNGLWRSIRYVVARGGNPLTVTTSGQSCLLLASYANKDREQTLSECIRHGLTTHQPQVTDGQFLKGLLQPEHADQRSYQFEELYEMCSPLQSLALYNHLTKHTLSMLYNAGSCSQAELFRFYKRISLKLTDRTQTGVQYLKQLVKPLATNPRHLVSLCRLVVSHQLGVSKPRVRKRKVMMLELPFLSGATGQHVSNPRETEVVVCKASNGSISPFTVNTRERRSYVRGYLLFSDIVHPDVAKS